MSLFINLGDTLYGYYISPLHTYAKTATGCPGVEIGNYEIETT